MICLNYFFSFRPWDSHNDVSTYENNFMIATRTHTIVHDDLSQFDMKNSLDDDITSILKRIERDIISTNERIESHERQMYNLQNHQTDVSSPYIQFILIIFVAIVLKYIFQ